MTWVAVPKLPRGRWVLITLGCGHIRIQRELVMPAFPWVFCPRCTNYITHVKTGIIQVRA